MEPSLVNTWLEVLRSLGLGFTAATVCCIWALYRGVVVWGWYVRAVEKERDEWKHAALSGTGILEKLVDRIEQRRL